MGDAITIDPEFRDLLRPLTDDERETLESNLLQEGCRDPLVLWGDTLLDGHNRFEICERYNMAYQTVVMDFPDRRSAMDWIDLNQIGKRNQTPDELRAIMGRVYNRRKKAIGVPTGNQNAAKQLAQIDPIVSTAETVAKEFGVSPATVKRAGSDVTAVETATPELKQAHRRGDVSLSDAAKAAKNLTPEEQIEVASKMPGKVGEYTRNKIEELKVKNHRDEEFAELVEKANRQSLPANYDKDRHKLRLRHLHNLYAAIENLTDMLDVVEMVESIPDFQHKKFAHLDTAVSRFLEFQKLYKETHHERLNQTA